MWRRRPGTAASLPGYDTIGVTMWVWIRAQKATPGMLG
jgi:hypothetical protein